MPNQFNDDINKVIKEYENNLKGGREEFYDLDTFEDILEYYFDEFKINKALTVCEHAEKYYPNSATVKVYRSKISAYTGNYKDAFQLIDEAEQISPNEFMVLFQKGTLYSIVGETDSAIDYFFKAIETTDSQKGEIIYNIAITLLSADRIDEAYSMFKVSLVEDDTIEESVYEMYDLALKLDMLSDAETHLEALIDQDPYNKYRWFNQGLFLSQCKQFEKALAAFEYATLIDDTFEVAFMQMGHCFLNTKEYANAFRKYLEALQVATDPSAELYCHLGASSEMMEDYNVGIRYFKKALEKDVDYDEAWFGVGENHRKLGNFLEATHYLNKAVKLNPHYDEYWYALAKAESSLGNSVSGIEAFKNACEINPNKIYVWLDWSEVYAKAEELNEGIETLKKAINNIPDNHSLYYRLAAYQLLDGKMNEAFISIEKALQLNYEAHHELVDYMPEESMKEILKSAINKFKR
ncbi:tetratricopeptide repeat protein [Flammeovirga pacifica]|uniref:Uncharacterized protein n=1 Tax=Flammeovirga pacifica TaxID=915059 RepID=A0A1S1Z2J1_FLAPC|nr:tetratricopeptide repeat protein [Flammeovirga pacifica]OHX67325.1 hypothetical protein NH26_13715 [Flammeovirga pacifica]